MDKSPHDLGGNTACGVIERAEHPLQQWEKEIHAVAGILNFKKVVSIDEIRRGIESLEKNQYESLDYYSRWACALASLLVEKNVLSNNDIYTGLYGDRGATGDGNKSEPAFRVGDNVVVQEVSSGITWRKPHLRVPGYIYGLAGSVEQIMGCFPDPSLEAFKIVAAPHQWLYRVVFPMKEVWTSAYYRANNPDPSVVSAASGYDGADSDTLSVEVYEPWLTLSHSAGGSSSAVAENADSPSKHALSDLNTHSHDHQHLSREETECNATVAEQSEGLGQRLTACLLSLLFAKGLVTRIHLHFAIDSLNTMGHPRAGWMDSFLSIFSVAYRETCAYNSQQWQGARLVVRAWLDPAFKAHLLRDPHGAGREMSPPINLSLPQGGPSFLVVVVENTAHLHNIIVCTLCSCYPLTLLGLPPAWYKSNLYRSRIVREPRRVLSEWGTEFPASTSIRVHDSTADCRFMVLPMRPEGTEEWSHERLMTLVTRNTMIGASTCDNIMRELYS